LTVGSLFGLATNWAGTSPKPRTMINVVRMYCFSKGVTWIEDYPKKEASKNRKRLSRQGVVVYHSEVV